MVSYFQIPDLPWGTCSGRSDPPSQPPAAPYPPPWVVGLPPSYPPKLALTTPIPVLRSQAKCLEKRCIMANKQPEQGALAAGSAPGASEANAGTEGTPPFTVDALTRLLEAMQPRGERLFYSTTF
jgi:hypothetical protein